VVPGLGDMAGGMGGGGAGGAAAEGVGAEGGADGEEARRIGEESVDEREE
jgi:hypothetical protein